MLLLILLATLLSLAPPPAHDYHVSKTNVRYVADREQVQIEMHLFVDDLERDMAEAGAPANLETGTTEQHPEAERYLSNYLKQNFRIRWNDTDLPLEMVGYELADDLHGIWIYQVASVATPPTEVSVANTLITGVYPDQKNIVKLFVGNERSATLLMSKDSPTATHAF